METVEKSETIYGINPISEALKKGAGFREILISRRKKGSTLKEIVRIAEKKRIPLRLVSDMDISRYAETKDHQGVAAFISPFKFLPLDGLIEKAFSVSRLPVIALLDEIHDPGNLGSIIRSAEVLGVHGLVITKDRSAGLTPAVFKRSAGALAHLSIARVTNLSHSIASLKERGFWVVGVEKGGAQFCCEYTFDTPVAIVIGSEAKGVRRLVKKNCDTILSIPMEGEVSSLNAASAATVIFYEILRQRLAKA